MMTRSSSRARRAGFSLLEVLIVLAIILWLCALATPQYLSVQQKAYEASATSFLRVVQSEQEAYRLANGQYAQDFVQLGLYAGGPGLNRAPLAPEPVQLAGAPIPAHTGLAGPLAMLSYPVLGEFPALQESQQGQSGQDSKFTSDQQKKPGGQGDQGKQPGGATGGTGGAPPLPPDSGPNQPGAGSGSGSGSQPGGTGGTPSGGTGGTAPGGTPAGGGSGGLGTPSSPGATTTPNIIVKNNYIFTLKRPTPTSWNCSVEPVRNRDTSHFMYIDQSGTIRSELGKPASSDSPIM